MIIQCAQCNQILDTTINFDNTECICNNITLIYNHHTLEYEIISNAPESVIYLSNEGYEDPDDIDFECLSKGYENEDII